MEANQFFIVTIECQHCFCIFEREFKIGTDIEHRDHGPSIFSHELGKAGYVKCLNCQSIKLMAVNANFPRKVKKPHPGERIAAIALNEYNKWVKNLGVVLKIIFWIFILTILILLIVK